eukprot:768767-Hanusia_phi.AAC.5
MPFLYFVTTQKALSSITVHQSHAALRLNVKVRNFRNFSHTSLTRISQLILHVSSIKSSQILIIYNVMAFSTNVRIEDSIFSKSFGSSMLPIVV